MKNNFFSENPIKLDIYALGLHIVTLSTYAESLDKYDTKKVIDYLFAEINPNDDVIEEEVDRFLYVFACTGILNRRKDKELMVNLFTRFDIKHPEVAIKLGKSTKDLFLHYYNLAYDTHTQNTNQKSKVFVPYKDIVDNDEMLFNFVKNTLLKYYDEIGVIPSISR